MNTTLIEIPLIQELVQHLFDYNPETGILKWINPTGHRIKRNDVICTMEHGYYRVWLYGKRYKVHRIIWLYMYGYLPENDIDHIDRDRKNNKLNNLREVSRQCNMRNVGLQTNNKSGVVGVSFVKKSFNWYANIMINKKTYSLGYYADYIEAACARLAAEQCLNWPNCNTKSTAYKCVQEWLNKMKTVSITGY